MRQDVATYALGMAAEDLKLYKEDDESIMAMQETDSIAATTKMEFKWCMGVEKDPNSKETAELVVKEARKLRSRFKIAPKDFTTPALLQLAEQVVARHGKGTI